jgi:hypothetical protein
MAILSRVRGVWFENARMVGRAVGGGRIMAPEASREAVSFAQACGHLSDRERADFHDGLSNAATGTAISLVRQEGSR